MTCRHDYLLSHEELSHQESRGESGSDNVPFFRKDVTSGLLDDYKGTAVAYHKGVLCGQDKDSDELFRKASSYYGTSSLAVFLVPEEASKLEDSVSGALGDIGFPR
jgi:hypothetical protein